VQVDGIEGGPPMDLIVTLDDATSEIYSMILVEEEGTASTRARAVQLGDRVAEPLAVPLHQLLVKMLHREGCVLVAVKGTFQRWAARYEDEGEAGLADRVGR
jgi:hypothetical protein